MNAGFVSRYLRTPAPSTRRGMGCAADIRLEAILHALSDPVRAAIFADIAGSGCTQTCSAFASMGDRVIPKSSLSQHFKVLREAGLIRSERQGVEMRNSSRCAEVEGRFPGLLPAILAAHAGKD